MLSADSSTVSAKMRSRDRHLTGDSEKNVRTQLSIIVPVFNEATLIRPFLQHLRDRAPEAEIIVADGRSNDSTVDLVCRLLLEKKKKNKTTTIIDRKTNHIDIVNNEYISCTVVMNTTSDS